MANKTILIKRSAVQGKVPATTDLQLGELGINTYDGSLYLKKSVSGAETVVKVGQVTTVAGRSGDVAIAVADVTGAAPLASPALTGVPTAPTASAGTNNGQIATTTFVANAVANAAAAGVSSFNSRTGAVALTAADVTNVGGALLTSPGFFGTPTAPTAAPGTNTTQLATTAFVGGALGAYAPVVNPVFFTSAKAPTPTPGDSSTNIATTAFVNNALGSYAPVVNPVFLTSAKAPTPAPGDSTTNVATTAFVSNALGSYAPVVNPVFLTSAKAPTPAPGDNTTNIATTAFVNAALSAGSGVASFNTRTGAVTLTSSDVTTALSFTPANVASPALTGTPTAPTATAGTNTTQLATTAFVASAVSAASGAVTSFNTRTGAVTLSSGDVTTALGFTPLSPSTGATTASPAFTGTPTAPTPTFSDKSTTISTTAYVQNAVNGSSTVAVSGTDVSLTAIQAAAAIIVFTGTLTANINVTCAYQGRWIFENSTTASAYTITVKSNSGDAGVPLAVSQSAELFTIGASNMLFANRTGVTPTGGDNSTKIATTAYVQTAIAGLSGGSSGVASFNTRTGAITLTSGDVTTALGFTPANTTTAAPLASPALTGTPTAPTATAGTNTTQVATTAFVGSAITAAAPNLSGYAPLASPALTGTPSAPTATAGTNTTQVATTAFVTAAVAAGGGSSGVASFNTRTGAVTLSSGDVTTALGFTPANASTAAPLASPALTGTPTGPTATAGTNNTQLATTAFVSAAVAAGGSGGSTGSLVKVSYYYVSTTWTPQSGTKSVRIRGVGGGGAGGAGTTTSGYTNVGTGGYGGAYFEHLIVNGTLSSATITIGAGGVGTTTSATAGGNTSFVMGGLTLTANGGSPGVVIQCTQNVSIPFMGSNPTYARPTASGANLINACGGADKPIFNQFYSGTTHARTGDGGDSMMGMGAQGASYASNSVSSSAGNSASDYGTGGAGSFLLPGYTAYKGGDGYQGFMIIEEYA